MRHTHMRKILLLRFKNPVFQKIKHPLHLYPPLTLKHIQMCLEQKFNYETRLIDDWIHSENTGQLKQTSLSFKPDCIIAYMEKPSEKQNLLDFISIIQDKSLLKIGIGPDITARPQEYLNKNEIFDFCIPGEPEEAISFFFDKLTSASVKKEDLIEFFKKEMSNDKVNIVGDLSQLNPLDFNKKELHAYPFTYPLRFHHRLISGYTMTSRGCPHHCSFCSPMIRKSYGKTIRHRPLEVLMQEIKNMRRQGANFISFEDDNFGTDGQWLSSFCQSVIKNNIKIKWAAQLRIDTPLTDENFALMKKSGCILLQLGVETASEKLLESLRKTSDVKHWRDKCLSIFKKIKKYNIATCALFMIGIPNETEQDLKDNIRLAIELDPDFIKLHFFTLYPGCLSYRDKNPGISLQDTEYIHHHNPPAEALSKKRNYFYLRFIFRPSYLIKHTLRYMLFYLRNFSIFKYLIKNTLNMLLYCKQNNA